MQMGFVTKTPKGLSWAEGAGGTGSAQGRSGLWIARVGEPRLGGETGVGCSLSSHLLPASILTPPSAGPLGAVAWGMCQGAKARTGDSDS